MLKSGAGVNTVAPNLWPAPPPPNPGVWYYCDTRIRGSAAGHRLGATSRDCFDTRISVRTLALELYVRVSVRLPILKVKYPIGGRGGGIN